MAPDKAELRRTMRARLRTLGNAREPFSRAICEAIARHPAYAAARVVTLFDPLPSEPAIDLLWQIAPRRFRYPRIVGETLELIEVQSMEELARTAERTFREPQHSSHHAPRDEPAEREQSPSPPEHVGLILIPGLAFTRTGLRLGRGGGYYDRLLATLPPTTAKLGVCFEMQIVETLPAEPHDMPVETVVTEID